MKVYLIDLFKNFICNEQNANNYDSIRKFNRLIEDGIIDVNVLTDEVIKIKNLEYIYLLAREVKGTPIDKLADAVIETGNLEYIYSFALSVYNAPIDKLVDAIIELKNPKYICSFAKNVCAAPIDKLADAVIETGNLKNIYSFALSVYNAPIDKLTDAVIAIKDPEYIEYFAKNVDGAPIDKLADAIMETRNAEYIYKFATSVKDAPIKKLMDFLSKLDAKLFVSLSNNELYANKFRSETNDIVISDNEKGCDSTFLNEYKEMYLKIISSSSYEFEDVICNKEKYSKLLNYDDEPLIKKRVK